MPKSKNTKTWTIDSIDKDMGICRMTDSEKDTIEVPLKLFKSTPAEGDYAEIKAWTDEELIETVENLLDDLFEK